MKRCLLNLFVFALTWGLTLATDPTWTVTNRRLSPFDVIFLNGQLNARDGIMAYTLKKDGSFSSFPLAVSGTWIEGQWKLESSSNGFTVQVEGRWGGVNQVSPNNQFITMRVMIQPGLLQDTGHPGTDSYKCSVAISEATHELHTPP